MPGLRRSRFPRMSAKHRSSWEVGPETAGQGAPQSLVTALAGTATTATEDGQTLIRTRGELLVYLKTAAAAGDGIFGAFGIAKATTAAVTAGVASVPTPIAEEAWDGWLYHRYFSLHAAGPIAVATAAQEALQTANVTAALRIEVDSKAMRKCDVNESIYAVIEVQVHGTSAGEWSFNCRQLFKLMA